MRKPVKHAHAENKVLTILFDTVAYNFIIVYVLIQYYLRLRNFISL